MACDPEVEPETLTENIINCLDDPFDGVDGKEIHYEDSYSGPSATHLYRRTMAVLIPKQHVDRFFCSGLYGRDREPALAHYIQQIESPDTSTREMAVKMSRILARDSWSGPEAVKSVNPKVVSTVLELLQRCQPNLFEEVLGWLLKRTDESTFSALKSLVVEGKLKFDQVRERMLNLIKPRPLEEQRTILSTIIQECGLTVDDDVRKSFVSEVLGSAVEKYKTGEVTEKCGVTIVNMVHEFGDFELFSERIIPLLELRTSQGLPFALAAIQQYWGLASKGQFGGPTLAKQHCKRLAKSLLAGMTLFRLRSTIIFHDNWEREPSDRFVQKSSYLSTLRRYTEVPKRDPSYVIDPPSLTKFFATCLENQWDDLLLQLTFKIVAEAEKLPWYEYRGLWLPFLQQLIAVLEVNGIPLTTPRYQQIAGAILDSFLTNYVQQKPPRDRGSGHSAAHNASVSSGISRTTSCSAELYRRPVECPCQDCHLLNNFLTLTSQINTRYILPRARLDHLQHQAMSAGQMHTSLAKTWPGCSHPIYLAVSKTGNFQQTVPASAHAQGRNGIMTTNDRERLAWARRATVAKDELDKFSQEKLKLLLGGDGVDGGEKLAKMRNFHHLTNSTQSKEEQHLKSLMSAPSSSGAAAGGGGGGPLAPMAINSLLGPNSGSGSGGSKPQVQDPAPVAGVRRYRMDDEYSGSYDNSRRRIW